MGAIHKTTMGHRARASPWAWVRGRGLSWVPFYPGPGWLGPWAWVPMPRPGYPCPSPSWMTAQAPGPRAWLLSGPWHPFTPTQIHEGNINQHKFNII